MLVMELKHKLKAIVLHMHEENHEEGR